MSKKQAEDTLAAVRGNGTASKRGQRTIHASGGVSYAGAEPSQPEFLPTDVPLTTGQDSLDEALHERDRRTHSGTISAPVNPADARAKVDAAFPVAERQAGGMLEDEKTTSQRWTKQAIAGEPILPPTRTVGNPVIEKRDDPRTAEIERMRLELDGGHL